jgi:hypothetical protein
MNGPEVFADFTNKTVILKMPCGNGFDAILMMTPEQAHTLSQLIDDAARAVKVPS